MLVRKGFLIVCLVLVSLVGDAQISLPDSMLTITKSYVYNITSPDTAQAILRTIRERQTEPAWRIDFAEGDLNYNMRRYMKALSYFERVKAEPSLKDSTHLQLLLYKRLMDCYDVLNLDDDLIRTIYDLRQHQPHPNAQKASPTTAHISTHRFTLCLFATLSSRQSLRIARVD